MLIIGLLVLAVAVAAAIVLVVQNPDSMMDLHALGQTWHLHSYWLILVGVVIAVLAVAGLALMRAGAAHNHRIRRERRSLAKENRRLSGMVGNGGQPVAPPASVSPAAMSSEPMAAPFEPVAAPVAEPAVGAQPPVATAAPARSHGVFHRHRTV